MSIESSVNGWMRVGEKKGINAARGISGGSIVVRETLAESLAVRMKGLEKLKSLDLPRYKNLRVSLGEFLADPEKYFSLLANRGSLFYPKILKADGNRVYKLGATKDEVLEFIEKRENDAFQARAEDTFILSEYFDNLYGGNLIINENGAVVVEVVRGLNCEIAHGRQAPLVVGETNDFTGIMSYEKRPDYNSKNDSGLAWTEEEFQKVREAIAAMIISFPKTNLPEPTNQTRFANFSARSPEDEDCSKEILVPGYFEFFLTKLNNEDRYQVFFSDAREARHYQRILPI